MVLDAERQRRLDAVGFDYARQPKVDAVCDLCGGERLATIARTDRYGFDARTVACLRCGNAFMSPRMTESAFGAFYASTYRPLVSAFHGRVIDAQSVEEDQRPYAHALVELLGPTLDNRKALRVLDVGGSTGVIAEALNDAFGARTTVIDPAPDEVERARARGLDAIVGTMEAFEAGSERFDLVTICQTIDHLLEVGRSLENIRSLLAEGGLVFVDIVDFRAAYLRAWSIEAATKIDHPHSLTEPTIEAYLARAGLHPLLRDYAPDHLHVGYVCEATTPIKDALPSDDSVATFFREIRYVQNAPRP